MKYFSITLLLLSHTVFAQIPSLNLPAPPTRPLTVVFRNVTQQNLFRGVIEALKKSKRVEDLAMARAQRGFIEYRGNYFGEPEPLSAALQEALGEKLRMELKPQSNGGLEILLTPL